MPKRFRPTASGAGSVALAIGIVVLEQARVIRSWWVLVSLTAVAVTLAVYAVVTAWQDWRKHHRPPPISPRSETTLRRIFKPNVPYVLRPEPPPEADRLVREVAQKWVFREQVSKGHPRLIAVLKELATENARAKIVVYPVHQIPFGKELAAIFRLAGWEALFSETAQERGEYFGGIEVRGFNQYLVTSVADALAEAGLAGVRTGVDENTHQNPEKRKLVEEWLRITIGHSLPVSSSGGDQT